MPFGEYEDMADCIAKNSDAEDPGAYCAQIHKDITGKWPSEYVKAKAGELKEVKAPEFDACIEANLDKPDPIKYCANKFGIPLIHTGHEHERREAMRHADFDRIYTQFLTHIKDEEQAEQRYFNWIKALNLDETKPYGKSMREQFRWVKKHVDFQLWKEDSRAKFWRVDAGYPLESMNSNVYLEDELYRSARTLKHTSVNLNHKFKLPTIDIVAAEYEDGVVEAVLRVPKNLRCPMCNTKKSLNDLIESGGIVNVSLEAVCEYNSKTTGTCEGMTFTGLALLTKDVLPGIPLTRMMPLEQIMVEALHVDETKGKWRRRKVKKIKMEVLEQDEEPEKDEHGCVKGKQQWDADQEKCVAVPTEQQGDQEPAKDEHGCIKGVQTWDTENEKCIALPTPDQFEQVPTVDITPVAREKPSMEPDAEGQCEPGYRINALGKCVPTEDCETGFHWDANANDGQGACIADTPPRPEHPETSHGLPAAPKEDVLTDAPTAMPKAGEQPPILNPPDKPMPPSGEPPEEVPFKPVAPAKVKPPEPHTCPDDKHWDDDANQCVPNTPLPEQDIGVTSDSLKERLRFVKEKSGRVKAEAHGKGLEAELASMEKDFVELQSKWESLRGAYVEQKKTIQKLHEQKDNAVRDFNNKCVEAEKWKRLRDEASGLRDDYMHQLETTKTTLNDVTRKYNDSLGTNLELSRKLTQAHEDYLEVASKSERLEAQLNKAKSISKKIYKLRV